MSRIKKLCNKCGHDGTYYIPAFHYAGLGKRQRCDGKFEDYEVFTPEERLAEFRNWLVRAIDLSVGEYAAVRGQVLEEFDKAVLAPLQVPVATSKPKETKKE